MADFSQPGLVTTLHDLGAIQPRTLEDRLLTATEHCPIGLVLPVTADDMQADPFSRIVDVLLNVPWVARIAVTMGVAPNEADYREAWQKLRPLGERAEIVWTDGERIQSIYARLNESGLNLSVPGKGRSVWTAFGYLLANPRLKAYVLHDCDIVNYERNMLARLCFPLVDPALDFEFCKAYYARTTDRMHGRVVRLLVAPLLRSLTALLGHNPFLEYLQSFRYPLSGEFAVTSSLARSNRIPSDWGLEVGTLAEVYRNTSVKRVCQVDLCTQYEHKHQDLSPDDPEKGLMKMATDILTTIYRTLAGMGVVVGGRQFVTLRTAYLRIAQDAIRQYHADSLFNGLTFDRHAEEQAVENFAERITVAGETFSQDPAGGQAIPNWTRVISAFPDLPADIVRAVKADADEFGGPH